MTRLSRRDNRQRARSRRRSAARRKRGSRTGSPKGRRATLSARNREPALAKREFLVIGVEAERGLFPAVVSQGRQAFAAEVERKARLFERPALGNRGARLEPHDALAPGQGAEARSVSPRSANRRYRASPARARTRVREGAPAGARGVDRIAAAWRALSSRSRCCSGEGRGSSLFKLLGARKPSVAHASACPLACRPPPELYPFLAKGC